MPRTDRRHDVAPAVPPDPEPIDQRDREAHDRDRILYSAALRRLVGVSQVAGAHEGRIFHNRLLHSLKVAQLARRLAERLLRRRTTDPALHQAIEALGGLNADVVEAAALAHDLGHPPFGHVAEKALDQKVRAANLPEGYEGNAQSFRIVASLATHPEAPQGCNLTAATLRAMLKYPWRRAINPANNEPQGKRGKKWGAYGCDAADFEFAMTLAVDPGGRDEDHAQRSLEAEIMDWADDVTYALHDLEDFYRAGLIPLDAVFTEDGLEQERFVDFAAPRLARSWSVEPGEARERSLEALRLVSGLLKLEPFEGTRDQIVRVQGLMGQLITLFFAAFEVGAVGQPLVSVRPATRDAVDVLKQLTWNYVIERPALATQQEGQVMIVNFLFDFYFRGLRGEEPKPLLEIGRLVPASLRHLPGQENDARLAADIVASLTEDEALKLYSRLTGHATGSLIDRLPT